MGGGGAFLAAQLKVMNFISLQNYTLGSGMIGIIVPRSHVARIHAAAAQRIKEDCVITVITIEDAITHIIALLVLILFFALSQRSERRERSCRT